MMKKSLKWIVLLVIVVFAAVLWLSQNPKEEKTVWREITAEDKDAISEGFAEAAPSLFYFPEHIPQNYSLRSVELRSGQQDGSEIIECYFEDLHFKNDSAFFGGLSRLFRAENIESDSLWFQQSNDETYNLKYDISNSENVTEEDGYYFQYGELENVVCWTKGSRMLFLRGNLSQEDMMSIAFSVSTYLDNRPAPDVEDWTVALDEDKTVGGSVLVHDGISYTLTEEEYLRLKEGEAPDTVLSGRG
ncbi:DUF4367 domain-containing protein [Anaerotignum lactatifermentans]|uniref:DUF4367 domain-containing protein n=1 Tax=Anaerotignum lactatifermentans TaxID=160404 RepID=A0ABS2G857_9FIRM|nr:DUF4367 domain-containing protein [Anaerotignum lactatifermentans]MBM6828879.1 DUF4367 domain-containing protein [Anaerotignum lactatifermentans]MBM6876948.1 DUF4367 domain-containing protein [Anaerotignum lactatifermentans]MBM6950506.1 DUF4367 domain-containing protein [Anaerotignum lactatifermentans]